MKRSTQVVNTLLLNIPISLALCIFGQFLSIWRGDIDAFSMPTFWINLPVSYVLATIVGLFVPSVPWGMAFARRCGAVEGSLKYAILMNVIVNTIFTLVLCFAMTWLNVQVLGHAPFVAVVFGFLENVIPIWIVCYLVSFIASPICRKLAERITR